jgi:hypothetical protein
LVNVWVPLLSVNEVISEPSTKGSLNQLIKLPIFFKALKLTNSRDFVSVQKNSSRWCCQIGGWGESSAFFWLPPAPQNIFRNRFISILALDL